MIVDLSLQILIVSSSINDDIFKNSFNVLDGIINWVSSVKLLVNFSLTRASLLPSVEAISKTPSEKSQTIPDKRLLTS